MIDLERELGEHLRRRAAAVEPRHELDAVERGIPAAALIRAEQSADPRKPNRWLLLVAAAVTVALVGGLLLLGTTGDDDPTTVAQVDATTTLPTVDRTTVGPAPQPTTGVTPTSIAVEDAREPLIGEWTSIDVDGSIRTIEILSDGIDSFLVDLADKEAAGCGESPLTVSGEATLDLLGGLVVRFGDVVCENGNRSDSVENLTLYHDPDSDTLTDNAGTTWSRAGTSPSSQEAGGMWPQSSNDDVDDAQALADAGDPGATWQLDPGLSSQEWWEHLRSSGSEIVDRFLREELGWDRYLFNPYQGGGAAAGVIQGVVYLRCGSGNVNPMYPDAPTGHQEAPGAERCAPTIDQFRYETVRLELSQPARRSVDGIWVVRNWTATAPFVQNDPQVIRAQASARLEQFLFARIAGRNAEGFVDFDRLGAAGPADIPLLYSTSSGAPYERFEIEAITDPIWPFGDMRFAVRLFTAGSDTVVEQEISVSNARLWLDRATTTENGQPVAVQISLLDGAVTMAAPSPWQVSPFFDAAITREELDERIQIIDAPVAADAECQRGPAPTDAIDLATMIRSNPELLATNPEPVTIDGLEGVWIDVAPAPDGGVCRESGSRLVLISDSECCHTWAGSAGLESGRRMRLFLIDAPSGTAPRVIAIALATRDARFEDLITETAPIVDSIRFTID